MFSRQEVSCLKPLSGARQGAVALLTSRFASERDTGPSGPLAGE